MENYMLSKGLRDKITDTVQDNPEISMTELAKILSPKDLLRGYKLVREAIANKLIELVWAPTADRFGNRLKALQSTGRFKLFGCGDERKYGLLYEHKRGIFWRRFHGHKNTDAT